MYLPNIYKTSPLWLTIDIEELEDANFGITPKKRLHIDYEALIKKWDRLCKKHQLLSTAFVLGKFAKKYPHLIQYLANAGHEIACHGLRHKLIYTMPFDTWYEETKEAKKILEDITGSKIEGFRAPSWSMPFQKRYYEALAELGFAYSSSYFPFKTYMYGNSIDRKFPFMITTTSGTFIEIPIPKHIIPFSGGFYMRTLPFFLIRYLFHNLMKRGVKPIIYTHPYELLPNLFGRFRKDVQFNLPYILTFIALEDSYKRFDTIVQLFGRKENV